MVIASHIYTSTNMLRRAAFILVLVLVGLGYVLPRGLVGAANIPACLSIDLYDPSPVDLVLQYNNAGGFQVQDINVLVTIMGVSDYNLSSQYRFAYYVEGSGIVQRGITFVKSSPEGTPAAEVQYEARFNFPIDKPGVWHYTLEITDGSVAVIGNAETCPLSQDDRWRQFTIVAAAPDANQIISGYCSEITPVELTFNHFTCVRSTFDESWHIDEDDCDSGYEVDQLGCFNGLSPSGDPLPGTSCVPCINPSQQKTQLGHMELCGENDSSECDRSIPELSCIVVTRDDDPWKGHSRCLYTSPVLGANEVCYRGFQECNSLPDNSFTQIYSCQPAEGLEPYQGKCLPDTSSVRCRGTEVPHPFCVSQGFGANAYCDINTLVCREGIPGPVEPDEPTTPPFDDNSTDFGIQNCPYSQVTETGGVNFKPQQGVLAGTAEYDRQRTEHFQCISCIAAGNSWTAIGCVDVSSPEGIFTSLIRLGIGVMGGVALLRMIWLGVVMGRSEEEGKIKEAWQGILATLGGIAAVVFSVLIIRILAVNILNVVPPGFFGL